jgi:glycosyltransferase involved in cell wall biosynthesis
MTTHLKKPSKNDSLYLVLPVPFRIHKGRTLVESQAANGLDRWADNFARVTVAAPLVPESKAEDLPGFTWKDIATLQHRDRIICQPLPWAYTPRTFLKHLSASQRLISNTIAQHQHLQFAIGGLVGDWAAVAALEAIKQHRRYAIHTDRVEHELIRKTAPGLPPLRRLRIAVEAPLMERYHRHIIRYCSLGLWHGEDCFRAYSGWLSKDKLRENHLIHDIHTRVSDLIDDLSLSRKLDQIRTAPTLNLCYAGRLDPMKAPLEWLHAIARARALGANIKATWFGEGPLLAAAQTESTRLQLDAVVHFPGFIADRATLLAHLRGANALLFTHVTPESPRILLEALVCGTPILGYANPFAIQLLETHGGGALVSIQDTQALGSLVSALAADRARLATITTQAAQNGRRFTDASVFAERSDLIHRFA